MGNEEELSLLQEQLNGLAKAVAGDIDLPTNMADYLVTLSSLKKRIEAAKKGPDPDGLIGTATGRSSSKNPVHSVPRPSGAIGLDGPTGQDGPTVPDPVTKPINRRAAIQHTRKLNESGNDI